jgi:hypothetical protein
LTRREDVIDNALASAHTLPTHTMNPVVQYGLIGLGVLIVLHFISFNLLWNPARYKEQVTLRAAHRAFLEDDEKLPTDLVPYKWHTAWTRLSNLYRMKLHRNAPRKFEEARALWGVDEDQYRDEVCCRFVSQRAISTKNSQVLGKWGSFGSVGLSGSMFFHSEQRHYLLKSLGRQFENHFLVGVPSEYFHTFC